MNSRDDDDTEAIRKDAGLIVHKNGAASDPTTGRIVRAPTMGLFTPGPDGTGRAARLKFMEDQRTAFAEGLVAGVLEGGDLDTSQGDAMAWRAIGKKVGSVLMSSKGARGLSELLRTAGELSGYVGKESTVIVQPAQAPALENPETRELIRELLRKSAPDYIEGEVTNEPTDRSIGTGE